MADSARDGVVGGSVGRCYFFVDVDGVVRFCIAKLLSIFILVFSLFVFLGFFLEFWWLSVAQIMLLMFVPVVFGRQRSGSFFWGWVIVFLAGLLVFFCVLLFFKMGLQFFWPTFICLLVSLLLVSVVMGWMRIIDNARWGMYISRVMLFCVAGGVFYVGFMRHWAAGQSIAMLQALFVFSVLVFSPLDVRGGRFWLVLSGLVLAFFASNILAVIDGVGIAYWPRVFQMVFHLVFATALLMFLRVDDQVLALVVRAVLLAILIYTLFLVFTWSGLSEPEHYDWMHNPPLFQHIRHLAYFLCIGMVTAAWASMAWQGGWQRTALLMFWLVTTMMLWSGSRGAFLAASVGILILLVRFPLRRFARVWLMILLAGLAAMLVSALFPVDQPGVGWLSAFRRSDQAASINQLSSGRLAIWSYLVPFIAERPWFGWGGEGFLAVWEGFPIRQAHNGLMQLLIEWGVIGAVLFLSIIAWLSFKGGRLYLAHAKAGETSVTLAYGLALLAALLALAVTDGIFYYGMPLTFLMIACAFIGGELIRHQRVAERVV